ncbi:GxxExxY protein [Kaistella sp. PBT33-4]|uniref:GxxExxY protein n=1 Tax=Kaistella sp. PBT33-4 TaxID=3032000 RepID=UPI0023D7E38D|nr:GxxExxY protein [Kaistella sp. PBT33-4]MDF0718699.1 GxxExxY protein [Kaistella sp. PBT33-4]
MHENDISQMVFDAGLKVHRNLGPGLLESAYEECLYYELLKTGLYIEKQKAMPLIYEEIKMDVGYRLDFLIEGKVVVEIKSVESLNEVHLAQVLTYLKLSKCKLGLLINFNVNLFKVGYRRILNGDVAL